MEVTVTKKAFVFAAPGAPPALQSVTSGTEETVPGYGDVITQFRRMKQVEYSWLRSMMQRYEDFSVVTRESLVYSVKLLGLSYSDAMLERIMDKYVHLELYPDAKAALATLKGSHKLAILSNGSTQMLNDLVKNTGLDQVLDATISIDSERI